MWAAITFSSFGDWLGLIANTALAQQLTNTQSLSTQGAAISGVLLVRLSPDVFFGPFAAAFADKMDRRKTVIIGDTLAGLLYASIALGYSLIWLYAAQFVIEAIGLFTQPAKQVIQTTIVPRKLLATANQISLFSVYGSVPVAAGVFALLESITRLAGHRSTSSSIDIAIVIALLLNTVSFLVSSGTVFVSRHLIPVAPAERERTQSVFTLLREGVGFVRGQPIIKGLYVGIIGAFAAGGLTVGVAQLWVRTLSAGSAGYSIMFGTVFTGLAIGMLLGPKVLPNYTRSRVFALAIASAGVSLLVMSLLRDFILAAGFATLVGLFAGMAWIIGYTMIGYEVEDRLRGRVFAFVLSSVRLVLLATIAVGPVLAGQLGDHSFPIGDDARLRFSGPGLTLLLGGILALLVGYYALARATPSRTRVRDLLRRRLVGSTSSLGGEAAGVLIAVDGADPDATAACALLVAAEIRKQGVRVTLAGHADDSGIGPQVRAILGPVTDGSRTVEPETAALLSAAAQADQVATVIRPALGRGEVVVCDRYALTIMAVYGGGRGADVDRIRGVDAWGTGGLRPDLTVVLPGRLAPQEPVTGALDAAGVDAVLREAADADPDRHIVLEPPVVELGAAVNARLRKLIATRSSRLTPNTSSTDRDAAAR